MRTDSGARVARWVHRTDTVEVELSLLETEMGALLQIRDAVTGAEAVLDAHDLRRLTRPGATVVTWEER